MNNTEKLHRNLEYKYQVYTDIVEEVAVHQFLTVIKPYCIRKGYKFSAGMGAWCIYDRDGNQINKGGLPESILNVLDCEVGGMDQNLGSLMPELD